MRSVCAPLVLALSAALPASAQTRENPPPLFEPTTPDLGPARVHTVLVAVLLGLVPGAVGLDLPIVAGDGPRFAASWPVQLPLVPRAQRTRTAFYTNHRGVLEPMLLLGTTHATITVPEDPARAVAVFRLRAGYRVVWHPRAGSLGVLAGVGSTVEFWPAVRPSVSPEIGVHVGSCCDAPDPTFTAFVRLDAWPHGDDAVRLSVLVGWSLW